MENNCTPPPPPPPDRNGKGKGTVADEPSAGANSQRPSVLSRIARSAADLGRDTVAGGPRSDDLAGLLSMDNKAGLSGPSAASAAAAGSSSGHYYTIEGYPGEGSRAHSTPSFATTPAAFASGHTRQHIAAQEDAFLQFLDGADIDTSIPDDLLGVAGDTTAFPLQAGSQADTAAAAATATATATWAGHGADATTATETTPPFSAAVAEQQSQDGLDVMRLLAGSQGQEEEPDYVQDVELAEDEVAGLQRALFGSNQPPDQPPGQQQKWDHVLNFVPAFVRPSSGASYENQGASYAVLGVDQPQEASRLWLDQWRDVLTRYDDEVWGGLAPLVAEAREEVEQLEEASAVGPSDGSSHSAKALSRLQQILGHLRGSQ